MILPNDKSSSLLSDCGNLLVSFSWCRISSSKGSISIFRFFFGLGGVEQWDVSLVMTYCLVYLSRIGTYIKMQVK